MILFHVLKLADENVNSNEHVQNLYKNQFQML